MQQSSTLVPSLRIYVPAIFSLMIIFSSGANLTRAPKSRDHQITKLNSSKEAINGHNDRWLEVVKRNIANQEYNIEKENGTQVFRSHNYSNNIASLYTNNELQLSSLEKNNSWMVNFTLLNIRSDDGLYLYPTINAQPKIKNDLIEYDHHSFVVQYQNTHEGVRQNVIVLQPVSKNERQLRVSLQVSADVDVKTIDNNNLQIIQKKNHQKKVLINYGGLKAWDAEGKELSSYLASNDNKIEWIVNVENATYPVTIDPISTTPDWASDFGYTIDFGSTVAPAGDVNGDGYNEVIVSTPAASFPRGRLRLGVVYLFYGSAAGLNTSPGWIKTGSSVSPGFGLSVSFAGDVNGDGFSDVAVSDYTSPNAQGKVSVYYGSANGLSDTPSWTAAPNRQNGEFGRSTNLAGDVNRDGYSDLIIGEPKLGTVYAYYGSPAGLENQPAWQASIGPLADEFGSSVSSAGDINNDGFSDVVIGTNSKTNGGIYVYYGSPTGLSKTLNWWTKDPDTGQSFFGKLVRSAGDVNGDGFSDIVIGQPDFNVPNGPAAAGKIFVYFGSRSGFRTTNYWSFSGNKDSVLLGKAVAAAGDLDGDGFDDIVATAPNDAKIYLFEGSSRGPSNGVVWLQNRSVPSIDSAGDINGDGFNDVLIAVPNFVSPNIISSRAEVYYGFHDGFINIACPDPVSQCVNKTGRYVIPPLKFQGDSLLPISYTITGATVRQGSGTDASGLFNPGSSVVNWTVTQSNNIIKTCSTKVFINDVSIDWFKRIRAGNYVRTNPGDINGDGFNDVINTRIDTSNNGLLTIYRGSSAGISKIADTVRLKEFYGKPYRIARLNSIDPAGDINGDGFDDILITSLRNGVYVYYGSANGLHDSADWHWKDPLVSIVPATQIGDVNGDGFSDILITSTLPGIARIFYGSAQGLKDTPDWILPDNVGETFYSLLVSPAGDVNGDGFDDIFVINDPSDIYLFTGSAGGLVQTPVLVYKNPVGYGSFAYKIGDINGDGFDDAIINKSDSAYLLLGYPGGLKQTNILPPQNSIQAGDINGDGFDDIVSISSFDGPAILYYGTPKGLVPDPNLGLACLTFVGTSGDINGDGFDDLIVNRAGSELGVYYGKANNINPRDCKNLLVKIPDTSAVKMGGLPNTIYLGYGPTSLLLKASVTGGNQPFHYRWSTGDTSASLRVHPSIAGNYRYSVVVTDSKGCKDSAVKNISVVDIRCANPLTIFFQRFFPELLQTPAVQEALKRTTPVKVCVTLNRTAQNRCVNPLAVAALVAKGATLGSCNSLLVNSAFGGTSVEERAENAFSISASPNPATGSFRLTIRSNGPQAVNLRISDISGRGVEIIRSVPSKNSIQVGDKLRPGTYFIEGIQGKERKVIKVVKM